MGSGVGVGQGVGVGSGVGEGPGVGPADPASGAALHLVGGVSPIAVTAKGDKAVLDLLAA